MKQHNLTDKILIGVAAAYNLFILFMAIFWLFTNKFACYKSNLGHLKNIDINENVTYGLFMAGALGGAFYCLRAIYMRLGEAYTPIMEEVEDDQGNKVMVKKEVSPADVFNIRAWMFWYIFRPIQGGVLALVLLALVNSQLMTIDTLKDSDLTDYFVLIGIGFLAGFGSHELMHKIQEVIQVVFAKSNSKPTNSKDKVKQNRGES